MTKLSSFSTTLPPDFPERMSEVLRRAFERTGWRFSCEGDEFTAEEVAAPDGLLPMWLHRAQGLMVQALGGEMPEMTYRLDGRALCGARPEPTEKTAPLQMWALFTHFAVEQWRKQHAELAVKGSPVPLDELYHEWRALIQSNQVKTLPAHGPTAPGVLSGLPINPGAGFGLPLAAAGEQAG